MGAALSAQRHGYHVERVVLPDDLGKDARAALVAATVPAVSIQESDATGLPGKPDHGVVAFSLRGELAMLPEVAPVVPIVCLPDHEGNAVVTALLCAQA